MFLNAGTHRMRRSGNMRLNQAALCAILALVLLLPALRATDITNCTNITSAGDYVLTGNIDVSTNHFPTCSDQTVSGCVAFSNQCYLPAACTTENQAQCILDPNCLWNTTNCNPNVCLGSYIKYPSSCVDIQANNVTLDCQGFSIHSNCAYP